MRRLLLPLLLLLAVPALAGDGWRYTLDPAGSDVTARVRFLGFASKSVRFPAFAGQASLSPESSDAVTLDVTLDLTRMETDSLTRGQLRGPAFFDVKRYPTMHFAGRKMLLTGDRTADVTGALTARGVTHDEVLHVTFDRAIAEMQPGQPLGLTGRMSVDRRRYGMTAMAVLVGTQVDVTIRTRMVPA
ncbi:MAG: YceI family protein [Sphingomonadales bacterium]|nr:YceI family protein [Sphingomonadales bacterium]